ncbi:MAG TPA: hypothetical protein VES70_07045, partial [Pseudomonas sp.]|nr:hypothetical protein [Pseudomonas sp.]
MAANGQANVFSAPKRKNYRPVLLFFTIFGAQRFRTSGASWADRETVMRFSTLTQRIAGDAAAAWDIHYQAQALR